MNIRRNTTTPTTMTKMIHHCIGAGVNVVSVVIDIVVASIVSGTDRASVVGDIVVVEVVAGVGHIVVDAVEVVVTAIKILVMLHQH